MYVVRTRHVFFGKHAMHDVCSEYIQYGWFNRVYSVPTGNTQHTREFHVLEVNLSAYSK